MDKKKTTKKLDAQELEKRKAPFASLVMSTDDGGAEGGGGFESGGTRRAPEPDTAPESTGPLRKTPIVYRSE